MLFGRLRDMPHLLRVVFFSYAVWGAVQLTGWSLRTWTSLHSLGQFAASVGVRVVPAAVILWLLATRPRWGRPVAALVSLVPGGVFVAVVSWAEAWDLWDWTRAEFLWLYGHVLLPGITVHAVCFRHRDWFGQPAPAPRRTSSGRSL